jgi:hypothetical protein
MPPHPSQPSRTPYSRPIDFPTCSKVPSAAHTLALLESQQSAVDPESRPGKALCRESRCGGAPHHLQRGSDVTVGCRRPNRWVYADARNRAQDQVRPAPTSREGGCGGCCSP